MKIYAISEVSRGDEYYSYYSTLQKAQDKLEEIRTEQESELSAKEKLENTDFEFGGFSKFSKSIYNSSGWTFEEGWHIVEIELDKE